MNMVKCLYKQQSWFEIHKEIADILEIDLKELLTTNKETK